MRTVFPRAALALVAVGVSAVYLAGTGDFREHRNAPAGTTQIASIAFHGGKTEGGSRTDRTCQAKGCHAPFPHKKGTADSAFNNFHQEFVECLACHGKDAEKLWRQEAATGGGGKVLRGPPAATVQEPHMLLRPAIPCRGCHSEKGRKAFQDRGVVGLREGFENPIALRMLEEGGTRWSGESFR